MGAKNLEEYIDSKMNKWSDDGSSISRRNI